MEPSSYEPPGETTYDAVVVGARCAGAATAMLLARGGWHVLAVDPAPYGSDTLSTHALMRGGVLQLHRWGLLDALRRTGAPPIRHTSFHYGAEVVEVAIRARNGVDALYAPRRTVLDALLVDAAREAGADVCHGVRAVGLLREDDGRVCGVRLQDQHGRGRSVWARVVVGADGLRSRVAQWVGAERTVSGRHATSVVYGHWAGVGLDGYHWYYRPGVSVGVIPTHDAFACVFVAVPPERFRREIRHDLAGGYRRLLGEVDRDLEARVVASQRLAPFRGFGGEPGRARRAWGPGWALVGDAGYFRDPITAHGMTDALRDAELLARALLAGTERALAEYEATRDVLSRGFFEATDRVASFDWDLTTVAQHHLEASREMGKEVTALEGLDGPGGGPRVQGPAPC
jgi:menaquinone-9 beta-reductase